jgi:hypothetical protein
MTIHENAKKNFYVWLGVASRASQRKVLCIYERRDELLAHKRGRGLLLGETTGRHKDAAVTGPEEQST